MESMVAKSKDVQLLNAKLAQNTQREGLRNSARGANELRALNLASEAQNNVNERSIMATYFDRVLGIKGQQASTMLDRDKVVMGSTERMNDRNQANKDNYLSNLSSNINDFGTGMQVQGKMYNDKLSQDNAQKVTAQGKYGDASPALAKMGVFDYQEYDPTKK